MPVVAQHLVLRSAVERADVDIAVRGIGRDAFGKTHAFRKHRKRVDVAVDEQPVGAAVRERRPRDRADARQQRNRQCREMPCSCSPPLIRRTASARILQQGRQFYCAAPWRARYARQPPRCEISSAPCTAQLSHRKPCTHSPSSSSTRPIPSGDGIAATNEPYSLTGKLHTSSSMTLPWSASRTRPGFGGVVPGSANSR